MWGTLLYFNVCFILLSWDFPAKFKSSVKKNNNFTSKKCCILGGQSDKNVTISHVQQCFVSDL